MKKDSLEEAIRMLVRVAVKMRKEGIELRWNMTWVPVTPKRSQANPQGEP